MRTPSKTAFVPISHWRAAAVLTSVAAYAVPVLIELRKCGDLGPYFVFSCAMGMAAILFVQVPLFTVGWIVTRLFFREWPTERALVLPFAVTLTAGYPARGSALSSMSGFHQDHGQYLLLVWSLLAVSLVFLLVAARERATIPRVWQAMCCGAIVSLILPWLPHGFARGVDDGDAYTQRNQWSISEPECFEFPSGGVVRVQPGGHEVTVAFWGHNTGPVRPCTPSYADLWLTTAENRFHITDRDAGVSALFLDGKAHHVESDSQLQLEMDGSVRIVKEEASGRRPTNVYGRKD